MARDDGAEAKVAAAVALTAALFSPRVRGFLRRGAVHGLAGVLTAGDALASFARGVSRGVQESTTGGTRAEPATTVADEPVESKPAEPSAGAAVSDAAGGSPRRARTRARVEREVNSRTDTPPPAASAVVTPGAAPGEASRE